MSIDLARERRSVEFAEYVKAQEEAMARSWVEDMARTRRMAEEEQKSNERAEAHLKELEMNRIKAFTVVTESK
jgi:hypothetical protein